MRALILKELYSMKIIFPIITAGVVFSCVLSAFLHDEKYVVGITILILASLSNILFFKDAKSGWNRYAKVFPYTRAQLVSAKYITVTITLALLTSIYVVYRLIFIQMDIYVEYGGAHTVAEDMIILFCAGILSSGIALPFFCGFEFGTAIYISAAVKGPLVMWLFFPLTYLDAEQNPIRQFKKTVCIFSIICIVLFALSWFISIIIYSKRGEKQK